MQNEKKKKQIKLPHTLVLIYMLVIGVYILTWFVPSGMFSTKVQKVGETIRTVTVPGTYKNIPKKIVSPSLLLTAPVKGFQEGVLIIAFLFIVGGAFAVIQETGAVDIGITKLSELFSKHPGLKRFIIPVLMTVFSLGGAVFGMSEETIPFIVIFVPLAISLGYDSIVGVCIPFLGASAGFAAAFFNPFTVGIAQGLSDIPLYSGIGYRLAVWVIGTGVMIAYVMFYAAKVKKNPKLSPVYELDKTRTEMQTSEQSTSMKWTWRPKAILTVFTIGMCVLVAGILIENWYIKAIAAVFMAIGIICGYLGKLNSSQIAQSFVTGAKDMMNVAFIIACGRSILIIAKEGSILDTLLYWASSFISVFPKILTAQMMFLTQSGLNFFVHSGTAQAALTMPIMAPLSDLVGITRQTTVLAFQLCEFILPILPTSAVTMGVLGVAKISWNVWAKWFTPLMIILIILSMLLLIPPVLTNWQ